MKTSILPFHSLCSAREDRHDGGEILDGVDAAERARAQEREDDGGALTRRRGSVSASRGAHMQTLNNAVVDGDAAIREELTQRHLLVRGIVERSTEAQ